MMSVDVDERGRITAYNPHDMTGNTGWRTIRDTISEPIFTEAGVPMYKYSRGYAVLRSQAEIDADTPEPDEPQPSEMDIIKQRLDEQDDALIELASLIGG